MGVPRLKFFKTHTDLKEGVHINPMMLVTLRGSRYLPPRVTSI